MLFRNYLNSHPKELSKYKKLEENLTEFYAYDHENYNHLMKTVVNCNLRLKFLGLVFQRLAYL